MIEVNLYDPAFVAISSPRIELTALTRAGVKLAVKMNASLKTGLYGASFTTPAPPSAVGILIDDLSLKYAPVQLGYMNGNMRATLPVCLYPLPKHSSGYQPQNAPLDPHFQEDKAKLLVGHLYDQRTDAIITYNVAHKYWTVEEGEAIKTFLNTLQAIAHLSIVEDFLLPRVEEWVTKLGELGINLEGGLTRELQYEGAVF